MSTETEYLVQARDKFHGWIILSYASSPEEALQDRDQYRDMDYLRAHTHGYDWSGEVRAIVRYTESVVTVSELPLGESDG